MLLFYLAEELALLTLCQQTKLRKQTLLLAALSSDITFIQFSTILIYHLATTQTSVTLLSKEFTPAYFHLLNPLLIICTRIK